MTRPRNQGLDTAALTWWEIADALWLTTYHGIYGRPSTDSESTADRSPIDANTDDTAQSDTGAESIPGHDRDRAGPDDRDAMSVAIGVPLPGAGAASLMSPGSHVVEPAWPAPAVLPGELAIARALRPLQRQVDSPVDFVLDEERTAERAAEEGLWLLELVPAAVRAFDVMLVIDTSASMRLWQRTAAEFRLLLERQGAFRDVRSVFLNSDLTSPGLRNESHGVSAVRPDQLVDPTVRRIVPVLTDGVGRAWRSGAVARLLARWTPASTVVVIQVLPAGMWASNGFAVRRTGLASNGFGQPNAAYHVPGAGTGAAPIPVLGMQPRWFARWATLLTGTGASGVVLPVLADEPSDGDDEADQSPDADDLTPAERVLRFRATATPTAFRLAGLLAAAPLTLQVMRAVQGALLPQSTTAHLAEVFNSGLLRTTETREDIPHPGSDIPNIDYEFRSGLRGELLATGTRGDTAQVLRLVNDLLGPTVPAVRDLRSALADPVRTINDPVATTREATAYIEIQRDAMRALAGPYSARAAHLGEALTKSHDTANIASVENDTLMHRTVPSEIGFGGSRQGSPSVSVPESIQRGGTSVPYGGSDVTAAGPEQMVVAPRNVGEQPAIWGAVPPRNVNFTGRVELLDRLRDELAKATPTAVLPSALQGLGGIGKTQIAVEYAYRHATDYDVVWWVPSEDPSQIQGSYVELAKRLKLPVEPSADTAIPAVREALRIGEPFRRWLLVFDNAVHPEETKSFFPAGNGHILVTSRNALWSDNAAAISVNVFTRAESRELLQHRNADLSDTDADRIADLLGDLPLAIEQAAAWRAQTGMSTDDYLELFEDKRSGLLESNPPTTYPVAVAAAWNVSLDRLSEENRGALELLQVCAYFAPEPIARGLFVGVRNMKLTPALDQTLSSPVRLSQAIRDINRYSLARLDHRSNTIQLHRLVSTVLRSQLDEQQHEQIRHFAHILLANGDPNEPNSVDSWPRYAELLPHVRACTAMDCEDGWVRRLAINTVVFLFAWGEPNAAREMAQELVDFWRPRLGAGHQDTLLAARWLGRALRVLGRFDEARAIAQHTLTLLRETLGDDHEDTLLTVQGVASDLRTKGDFEGARALNQDAYDRARKMFGDDDPETLGMANNYALSLRLVGDFGAARKLDEDTWRRKSRVLGENHRHTLLTLDNWSVDLREDGDYVAACRAQEDTVRRFREYVGPRHPMTLAAIKNLAVARRKAGQHRSAQVLAQEALDGFRDRYGEVHPDAMSSLMNLSIDCRQNGDLPTARRLGMHAHELYRRTWGEDHPFTLAGATNLAVTLRLLGERDAAVQLNTHALSRMRTVLGANHPFTLACSTNNASDLAATGDFAAAHELDQDTLTRSRTALSATHPSTLAVAYNISLDLRGLGRETESDELLAETVALFRTVLGAEHPATVASMHSVRANCDIDPMQI